MGQDGNLAPNHAIMQYMSRDDLYTQLTSTPEAPRSMIVGYLKSVAEDIGRIPTNDLAIRSGESQFREAQSQGEVIAAKVLHVLLPQSNVDNDVELQEIRNIAQELIDQNDDLVLWAEFMDKVEKLRV